MAEETESTLWCLSWNLRLPVRKFLNLSSASSSVKRKRGHLSGHRFYIDGCSQQRIEGFPKHQAPVRGTCALFTLVIVPSTTQCSAVCSVLTVVRSTGDLKGPTLALRALLYPKHESCFEVPSCLDDKDYFSSVVA